MQTLHSNEQNLRTQIENSLNDLLLLKRMSVKKPMKQNDVQTELSQKLESTDTSMSVCGVVIDWEKCLKKMKTAE